MCVLPEQIHIRSGVFEKKSHLECGDSNLRRSYQSTGLLSMMVWWIACLLTDNRSSSPHLPVS